MCGEVKPQKICRAEKQTCTYSRSGRAKIYFACGSDQTIFEQHVHFDQAIQHGIDYAKQQIIQGNE